MVLEKTSQELSWTEWCVLSALSELDVFLLNPQVRTCSKSVPGKCINNNSENREPTGDCSLDSLWPKARFSACHSSNLNDSEQEKTNHMVIGVPQEISYCSVGLSSGKPKKARSTSQPQFCSEQSPVKIEADQLLLAFQQLATNSISANFSNIVNRISKLSESLTTTMPTFDGKSEKFEFIED